MLMMASEETRHPTDRGDRGDARGPVPHGGGGRAASHPEVLAEVGSVRAAVRHGVRDHRNRPRPDFRTIRLTESHLFPRNGLPARPWRRPWWAKVQHGA